MSYEKDLEIDKHDLHNEWNKHSIIFMRYVKLSAEAGSDTRRAKEKISVVRAELGTSIRTERENQALKTTEALLVSLIDQHKDYRNAVSDHIDAVEKAEIMAGAVQAFAQRKYGLQDMVQLYLAGYFSSPKDIKDEYGELISEKAASSSGKKQKEKLNKKRSKK